MKKINADTAVGLNALFVCLVTAALPTITKAVAPPSFTSASQEIIVFEGQMIQISCVVENVLSSQIVFWLNGSRIISTNRRVYADKQRVSIEGHGNTYNLLVRNVQQWDDGEYSCQVPGPHTIVQTSRVIISSPPSVEVFPGAAVTVDLNENLTLDCRASGRPEPTVTWSRSDKQLLTSGRQFEEGNWLTVDSVQRSTAGLYVCTADNGVGDAVSRTVDVTVRFGPLVDVALELIYTGPGHSPTIECVVESDPKATVMWYHNSSFDDIDFSRRPNIISTTEIISDRTDIWRLEFTSLQPEDLGVYTCAARNDIGIAEGIITLSPLPYGLQFTSKPVSRHGNQYAVQWIVSSYSPLVNFTLYLKQLNDTYEMPWVEYNIPVSSVHHQPSHTQQYLLQGLTPGSEYVATMRARNVFGAGEITEEFLFRTASGLRLAASCPLTVIFVMLITIVIQQL